MQVQRRHIRTIGAVVALAGGLLLSSCSSDASADTAKSTPSRSVTATATGTATGVPDQLTAQVGIANQGPTAAGVLSENNTKTQALLDQIKGAGIDDKDVSTTSVELGPTYDDKGTITGYQATNLLRVTLRDLKTAGARLDALVKAGGDQARIQGISLGFQDDDELLTKARVDAVKRAKSQAKEMAEAAGAKLGSVRTITDEVSGGSYPLADRAMAQVASDSSVPIAAGSEDLSVEVRIVYELS